MPNTAVVGAQWGDEGKAKVIDYLTERSDMIVRYQGGANAGHTVIADGEKFVFHMVPSGIMYPDKKCLISNGVVFDIQQFLNEVDELQEKGIDVSGRLFVSENAHIVLPYHKVIDGANEAKLSDGKKIGTTGRGIGPCYADKVNRSGIRIGELKDWESFIVRLTEVYNQKKSIIEDYFKVEWPLDLDKMIEEYKDLRDRLMPYITDTSDLIHSELSNDKSVLFEGAQGTFLDIDHGTYPFVTSSNTTAGSVCTGSGVGPSAVDHVVGIVKTYTTRVGNGPFPTELNDEDGEKLGRVGHEFGATTGRRRRCGWFDSVLLRKAIQINGFTRLALTKLDVLSEFDEIKVCTHYEIDGKEVNTFPSSVKDLEKVVPVYETHKGWKEDISGCKKFEDLPELAQKYVNRLIELCYNIPALIVSVGPDRNQTMEVEPIS